MTEDRMVQAGWFPDPLGLPQLRWWDGLAWTEHTSDARRPLVPQTVRSTVYAEPERRPAPEPQLAPAVASARPAPTAATPHADDRPALPSGISTTPELGWAGAALALNSVRVAGTPMVIELEIDGHPTIVIDTRHAAYTWQLGLDRFPEHPRAVRVSIDIVPAGGAPVFTLPGQPLDALLWKIGRAGFPDRIAPWLNPGEAYRLERWPNLTTLEPEPDQIRQTAMLANGGFTIDQLAYFTGRSMEPTRSLVNALSLMGTLAVETPSTAAARTVEPVATPTATPTPQPDAAPADGLFARLRQRLGL